VISVTNWLKSAYHNKHYLSMSASMFMFFKQKISASAEMNLRKIVYNHSESKKIVIDLTRSYCLTSKC
jgi:hypothetical protein